MDAHPIYHPADATLKRLACATPNKDHALLLCLHLHGGCMCKEDLAAFLQETPRALERRLARLSDPVTAAAVVVSADAGTVHLRPVADWQLLPRRHWRPVVQRALPFPPGLAEAMAADACPGSGAAHCPEPAGDTGGAAAGRGDACLQSAGHGDHARTQPPTEQAAPSPDPEPCPAVSAEPGAAPCPDMKPKIDSWMPLYIGDYLADTGRLSTEAHGAYLLLLMDYWRNRRPLPDDDHQLAAIAKLPIERWRTHKPVLRGFFSVTSDGWVNKRIERELERARGVAESRRKAAEARWAKAQAGQGQPPEPDANACAPHMQTGSQPQPQPQKNERETLGGAGGVGSGSSGRPGPKPASIEECLAHGGVIGMSPDDCRAWYRDAEACGWSRGDGTPYDNWRRQMVIHRDFLTLQRQRTHGNHKHSSQPGRPGVDRGAGTLNAGAAGQYRDLGTVV